ncbi:DUF4385 domain-containing protein [Pedobacter miscanthi]|uniref:DUF4385 domain-containing protein n=1 Tax=Pedobacter miscanthi TaxID=2259170 RepID=A0A366LCV0_9SPHI|nr:DUF4385 domain-containing protein [Pedobacter miscanthi]RBQ11299.1 DUF4385 domain-containing protein [Pedobacter miscanthi]
MAKAKVNNRSPANKLSRRPSYLDFDLKGYPWRKEVDYKQHPDLYRVGKGEQGVLICEPYKSIIGPLWRFKDPEIAQKSAGAIYKLFLDFISGGDFVGADLARKYLQMGYTRARRYANYRGGQKYDKLHDYALLERGTGDEQKARAAEIFYTYWKKAEEHPVYRKAKASWKKVHG